MRSPKIVVIGSSNTDMVARAPRLPAPGETVLGSDFAMFSGGKGANQAVAAARLGADVIFIARIGQDLFGDRVMQQLRTEGINLTHVIRDSDLPSGIALIGVSTDTGENSILVASGANMALSTADVELAADQIRAADVVVCQLESPVETVAAALALAHGAAVITVLNPAPAQRFDRAILRNVTVLTPNEEEALAAAGQRGASAAEAAATLRSRGAASVVVTLGSAGALLSDRAGDRTIASRPVESVVDTTAAGDCFTGALAVALAEGRSLDQAVQFANAAAGISVTRSGAQTSLPYRNEVAAIFGE